MVKLNINLEYETIDCDCSDKIVVIKLPRDLEYCEYKMASKVANKIKELCNAKSTVIIQNICDIDLTNEDEAIKIIDARVEEFNKLKEDLLKNKEGDSDD